MIKVAYSVYWLIVFSVGNLQAQDTLYLQNPSFEDTARYSRVPEGWLNGGFPGESPPDVAPSGYFRETTPANHGDTYLAMVTRDGGTWERIGNRISAPLQAGVTYRWSIDLARSAVYFSVSRVSGRTINFNMPVILRVLGGKQADEPLELLAVSPLITHPDWQRYTFCLRPQREYPILILEAMYRADAPAPYAGNLLLDRAGPLVRLPNCNDEYAAELLKWTGLLPEFTASDPPAASLDTVLIADQLDEISTGHIDIGLYELAALVRKSSKTRIVLTLNDSRTARRKLDLKILRKRVRAMRLANTLRIKTLRVEQPPGTLLASSRDGTLQVWTTD